MPATLYTCHTNIRRIEEQGDPAMNKVRTRALKRWELNDENALEIWEYIKSEADRLEIGDHLPGTVGRQYAARYGKIAHRRPNPKGEVKLTPAGVAAVKNAGTRGKLLEYDLTHPAAALARSKPGVLVVYAPGASRDVLVRWSEEAETDKELARRTQVVTPIVRQLVALLP